MGIEDDLRAAFERIKSETADFIRVKTGELEKKFQEDLAAAAAAPATPVAPPVSEGLQTLLGEMNAYANSMDLAAPAAIEPAASGEAPVDGAAV
jgi:hypothetical protein